MLTYNHGWCTSLILLFVSVHAVSLSAQTDQEVISDILEQNAQDLEQAGDVDNAAVFDQLGGYLNNPLDLNSDDLADLVSLGLLSDLHLFSLRMYIRQNGPLISVYELQAVPGFDVELIRKLRPYITTVSGLWTPHQSIASLMTQGKNRLMLRWGRTVQSQSGFIQPSDSVAPPYRGDPNKVYVRFLHRNANRLSYGVTMEKDPGEEFFSGSNRAGFDFYSAHLFLNNYRPWLPRLALGDFTVSIGQGLIMHSGYSFGKSAAVTLIKKGGPILRPFSSVNEADFLRGVGITLLPARHLQGTIFTSSRKRDANIVVDTLDVSGETHIARTFSSLQLSGLHRTDGEIADERQVEHRVIGTCWQYERKQFRAGFNVVFQSLSSPLQRTDAQYNLFRLQGDALLNTSFNYTYQLRNFHFFGETAWSDNGAFATIDGVLIAMYKNIDLAALLRFLPPDYHSLGASPFAEASSAENEHGIYLGIESRPAREWTVSGYADIWQHPWLRFSVDAPGTGEEQLVRITYRRKHLIECYLQYRHEQKEHNASVSDSHFHTLLNRDKNQLRLHCSYHATSAIELRSRIECVKFHEQFQPVEYGFALYQDVLYKPIDSDISFTTRIAFFDTDSYDTAIYAYENDLVNQFYIPAYAYRGVRYYFNIRYRGIRNLSLEFRAAQTRFTDRDEIGGGNDLIKGNLRTDLKAQVISSFE